MAAKTRAEKRIAQAPASSFRKLSKSELEKIGASPKSERFIEIGKRVAKNALTISKRAFTTKQFGAGPEALSEARAEGRIPYRSSKTQAAALRQRETRGKKPLGPKRSAEEFRLFERKAAKISRMEVNPAIIRTTGRNAGKPLTPYNVSEASRFKAPDLLRRWLAGERLSWEEWGLLRDYTYTTGSPFYSRLLAS